MKNDTCVICGKQFDKPRTGKLYCSNKCKQAAFDMKVHENGRPKIDKEVPIHSLNVDRLYQFNLYEFEQVKNKSKMDYEAEIYWFFRKNLSGPVDLDQIISYLKDFLYCDSFFWLSYDDPGHPVCKSFKEFQKDLHGPGVQFYYDENLNSKPICIEL